MAQELAKMVEPAIFAEIANAFHRLEELLVPKLLIVLESLVEMLLTTFAVATKETLVALDVTENHLAKFTTTAEFAEEMEQPVLKSAVSAIALHVL